MKVNIQELCGKKTVTREDGARIHEILSKNWDEVTVFRIDFDNILVASVSFMDEAFGQLALRHSKNDLQSKMKLENMVDYDRALLNDILYSRFRQKALDENGPSFKQKKAG